MGESLRQISPTVSLGNKMAAMRGVYLVVLVLYAALMAPTQGYDLMDSLTLRALMKQQPPVNRDEATKSAVYNAMLDHLNQILLNDLDLELDLEQEENELWPIFAPGGEYGPKYDVMDDEDVLTKRGSSSEVSAADLFVDAFSKKDLESLLHQPDPSLTVQELPLNPKISFRKGLRDGDEMSTATTMEPPTSSIGPRDQGNDAGMKEEVAFLSPAASWIPQSPFVSMMEAKQLRSLPNLANKKNF